MCYRIVTRGVLPALLMRFSGPAGLICGVFVLQERKMREPVGSRISGLYQRFVSGVREAF